MRPRIAILALAVVALVTPVCARSNVAQKKQLARSQFEQAERLREALNGRPAADRKRRDFERVIEAYRRVYYTAPSSNQADAAVLAVAELLAEEGRALDDAHLLKSAIGQYEFLRREYPGSKYRVEALFTSGEIYKEDLDDPATAKATFEEFLKHFPGSSLADDARAAIAEINKPVDQKARQQQRAENRKRYRVTGVRTWSTPDYTRIAVDVEGEVAFHSGRIPRPARIYFDLPGTYIASVLRGKTFEVGDGFLRKVRVAQFSSDVTRVVLDVEQEADVNAFLLPNPYRLIIDIHGRPGQRVLRAARQKSEVAKPETSKRETAKDETEAEAANPPAPAAARTAVAENRPPLKTITDVPAKTETASTLKPRPASSDDEEEAPAKDAVVKASAAASKETVAKLTLPSKIDDPETARPSRSARRGRKAAIPIGREAQPAANGERSLIRALGLKIGRIVVDAGHGGHDTGTIGPNGLMEKDLVLDVAMRLGKLLERMGAEVVYTREDDTFIPLETRTAIANQHQADLFISVHANSSDDSDARGVETYYLNFTSSRDALEVAARENAVSETSIYELQDLVKKIALKEKIEESREFAADVQHSLHGGLSAKSPGIRNRGVKKAPFIVLIGANMPSILAEISFVSNPGDEKRLRTPEWRQRIAESLYRGIAKYVSGLSGIKVASASREAASQ